MNKRIGIVFLLILFVSMSKAQTHPNKRLNTSIDSNLILKRHWGVSFVKSSNWSVTNNTSSKITLTQISGESTGDVITIEYVSGDSITDIDTKFGWITYRYDNNKQAWMQTDNMEGEGIYSHPSPVQANAIAITKDGLQIFHGTGRWVTYIIPLSHTKFLKLNIMGSGESQPLEALVKIIRKI
ncbi:MAG TPA: hypothetical protein VET23_02175 [Chitinophagaceae bacterium]|nr:hypothetical protein [Chitinophagaceae bacterium]